MKKFDPNAAEFVPGSRSPAPAAAAAPPQRRDAGPSGAGASSGAVPAAASPHQHARSTAIASAASPSSDPPLYQVTTIDRQYSIGKLKEVRMQGTQGRGMAISLPLTFPPCFVSLLRCS